MFDVLLWMRSCRRNSFVVVGDEEDIALGFYDGTATEGVRSSRKNGHDASTAADAMPR